MVFAEALGSHADPTFSFLDRWCQVGIGTISQSVCQHCAEHVTCIFLAVMGLMVRRCSFTQCHEHGSSHSGFRSARRVTGYCAQPFTALKGAELVLHMNIDKCLRSLIRLPVQKLATYKKKQHVTDS